MPTEAVAPRGAQPAGTIAFALLVTLLALAPLPYGANRPWAWDTLAVLAGLAIIAWAAAAWRAPWLAPIGWRRHAPLAVPFIAVIGWALFQASSLAPASWQHPAWRWAGEALGHPVAGAIALDPEAAHEGVIRLAAYGAVFWLALQLGRDARRARQLVWAVTLIGVAYAIYGLAIQLGGKATILGEPKWAYAYDLTSTFVNRNAYSVEVGLALLAGLALLGEATRPPGGFRLATRTGLVRFLDDLPPAAYLLAAAALALSTALVLTHSRGGLVAVAAATAVMAVASALRPGPAGDRRGLGLGVGALAAGLVVLSTSGGFLLARIELGLGQGGGREAIHALARRAIADAPWTGSGLGSFAALFRLNRGDTFGWITPPFTHAHSVYLELAAELGIPAAAALVGVGAGMALLCLMGAGRRRRARLYPCLGLAATALVGVQGLYDFAVEIPAVTVTWLTLAGVGCAQSFRTQPQPRAQRRSGAYLSAR